MCENWENRAAEPAADARRVASDARWDGTVVDGTRLRTAAIGGLVVCGLLAGGAAVPIAVGDPGSGGAGQDHGSQTSEDSTGGRGVNGAVKSDDNGGNLGGGVNAKRDQDSGDPKDNNPDPKDPAGPEGPGVPGDPKNPDPKDPAGPEGPGVPGDPKNPDPKGPAGPKDPGVPGDPIAPADLNSSAELVGTIGGTSFWTWLIQLLTGSGGTGGGSSDTDGGRDRNAVRTVADIPVDEQRELAEVVVLLAVLGAIVGLQDDAGDGATGGGGGGAGPASLPLAQFAASDAVTELIAPAAVDERLPAPGPPPTVSMLPPEPVPVAGPNHPTLGPASVPMPGATGRLPDDFRVGYPAYLRSASMSEVARMAMLGLGGLITLTAAGGVIGYRQAKAGLAVRAAGTGRFLQ
jgi:hypothetical protein